MASSEPASSADPTQSSSSAASQEAPATQTQPPSRSPPKMNPIAAASPAMTSSSTPLGNLNTARRPPAQSSMSRTGSGLNADLAAKMKAFHLERRSAPVVSRNSSTQSMPGTPGAINGQTPGSPTIGAGPIGGIPSNFKLPPGVQRPITPSYNSAPNAGTARGPPARGPSLAEKRGLRLPGGLPGAASPGLAATTPGRQKPKMSLADVHGKSASNGPQSDDTNSAQYALDKYSEYIDKETGTLRFKGKAVLDSKGVKFASGKSFSISLDEVETMDELGKGNYGTVYKVRHSRPQIRRPGVGLSRPGLGYKDTGEVRGGGTGMIMALKELRLELDDAKFAAIIMELDVLHRCVSPYIVDFYGAFFQEGAVYICMEFMNGGSVDKLYGEGMPEGPLRKITYATTKGLKSLKEEHNIIHRDVKPTNILVNTMGAVKICDFGVSGNLVASIAKTNIGCQSYMAPERISSGGVAQAGANPGGGTYSVQSDIWSLGLTIIESAMGRYPYPPETYDNIFSQLSAIVDGAPPDLPADKFSEAARNFVAGCLNKIPKLRPTYAMLLQHAWLAPLEAARGADMGAIAEEDEEEVDDEGGASAAAQQPPATATTADAKEAQEEPVKEDLVDENGERWVDREVGRWVRAQLARKAAGGLVKQDKPALHAVKLDAMPNSPEETRA